MAAMHEQLYAALAPLVDDRVYPLEFPQALPTWPAIRYSVISMIPGSSVCGDAEDEASDWRVQIDVAAADYDGVLATATTVRDALMAFDPTAILEGWGEESDPETGTYRVLLDYTFHPSSVTG